MYCLLFSSASSQSRCHSSAVLPSRTASRNAVKTVIIAKKLVHPCLKLFQEAWLGNAVSWGPQREDEEEIIILPTVYPCSSHSATVQSVTEKSHSNRVPVSASAHMGMEGY